MAIANPYQATLPAQAQALPGPQAQGPSASAFDPVTQLRMAQEKAAALSEAEKPGVAANLYAANGPAPPDPTTGQQGLGLQGEGQVQPAPDDGVGGWLHFLNQLADPEGPSRFLLETSANILSPRPEQVSGASHVASGLADSVGRLGQRRTAQAQARSQRELEAAKIGELGARSELYGQRGDSLAAGDTKIPSEIRLNNAKAYAAYQTAKSSARPAAAVQLVDSLAASIMAIAPDVHTIDSAKIQAQMLVKGGMDKTSFLKDFGALMAMMGTPGDISAMGLELADSMGLQDAPTLESIQQNQTEAVRQKEVQALIKRGPDAVFDEVRKKNPTATYEQVQAKVLEMTGKESDRPNWDVLEEDELNIPGASPSNEPTQVDSNRGRNTSLGSGSSSNQGTLGNLGRRRP